MSRQEIHPFNRLPAARRKDGKSPSQRLPPMGAARLRRESRRSRRLQPGAPLLLLVLVLVGLALLSPIVVEGRSLGPLVSETFDPAPATQTATPLRATATPLPSPTPTLTRMPTATTTPLPPHQVAATAWQATLDQAILYSHATQTQGAGDYWATQTALPPTLTAMAQDRASIATQQALSKAATSTARAARP